MSSFRNKKNRPAPFSFHCVICFEAFHLADRPPVVLPCGHTYLCEPCSKRLKRCMECRTSLFVPKQQVIATNPPPTAPRYTRGGRYSYQNQPQASPQRTAGGSTSNTVTGEIPLPLPKNQVMMALMELSSFTLKEPKETNLVDDSDSGCSEGYADEDALVFDGIESLRGQCGTYVVREKEGLVVQSRHPHQKTHELEKENKICDSNRDESRFNILSMDSSRSFLTAKSSHDDAGENNDFRDPTIVAYGQKVQVVDRVDGVFRLARNRGFIIAKDSQLVKVGAPLEQCCKIEGRLCTLSETKRDLQNKLDQLMKDESNLNRQLTKQRSLPEGYPIISDPTPDDKKYRIDNSTNRNYHNPYEDDQNDFNMTGTDLLSPSLPNIKIHTSYESRSVASPTPISPPTNHSSTTPPREGDIFQLSDDEDDNNVGNGEMDWRLQAINVVESLPDPTNGGEHTGLALSPFRQGIICGSSLFPRLGLRSALSGESAESVWSVGAVSTGPCGGGSINSVEEENSGDRGIEMSYSVPAPSRSWSNRSWTGGMRVRSENGSPRSSALNSVLSNKSVDFRTGMSGHLGLGSAVKDVNGRRSQTARSETRMMSEHRGIGTIRPIRKFGSPRCESKAQK